MKLARRLAVLAAGLLALGGPAAAQAIEIGLGDQKPAVWSDPRLRALGLRDARLIVPYDAATSEPDAVAAWLAAVSAAGLTPAVAFEHLAGEDCSTGPCTLPSRAVYAADVRAFIARFPTVRTYTTWNEANHESQPTASRPEAVAGFYAELRQACPACTVVAGDVLDSGSYRQWLQRFEQASTLAPRLWGLHDYGDVTYGRTTGVDTALATVPGTLWIEETGGIVSLRNAVGRLTFSTTEAAAATAVDRAFALLATRPRIARMDVYQWQAAAADRFDAGLVRPDGTARPALAALARGIAAQRTAATASTTAAPALRWTAAWSRVHPDRLLLRARCRAVDRVCRGRVTATLRARAPGRRRSASRRLAVRRYGSSSAHPVVAIGLRVSRAERRRLRRGAARRLVLAVRATRPAATARTTTLVLARPA